MFYVLLKPDGSIDRYPYTLTDLKFANPNTSFAAVITDEAAAEFNCFPVTPTEQPAADYTVNLERTAVKNGDQWVEEWYTTPATEEEIAQRTEAKAIEVRQERNQKLEESDWTQLADSPLSPDDKGYWALYRETLRMIPQQPGFPWNVQWPPKPGVN